MRRTENVEHYLESADIVPDVVQCHGDVLFTPKFGRSDSFWPVMLDGVPTATLPGMTLSYREVK
jgi:hypothetical protein